MALPREGGGVYNAAGFTRHIKEFTMRTQNAIGIAVAVTLLALAGAAVSAQTPPATKKPAPPLRGQVEVGYTQSAKLEGNTIVSIFEVKNLSATGSIVGLQLEVFWYDKPGGDLLQGTGDRQRLRTPLGPGEVTTITLRSPKVPGMTKDAKPQYKFSHQYGDIKVKLLKTLKTT
jgi:hypothetical protein